MAGRFIDTPRTDRHDETKYDRSEFDHDLSILPSFNSPSRGNDDMIQAIRGNSGGLSNRILATPRTRNVLGDRRNPPGKAEFTPMLKSATMNRFKMAGGAGQETGLRTPAALKPGFKLDATPNLELSEVTSSSIGQDDHTPIPPIASSSIDLSTPMIMPNRGKGGVIDNGNVLTLREQEQRLEQIDKENFGLKLKIHYLEENMRRSGPEANQIALRENSDLKVSKAMLERDLKKNMKSLRAAERDLENYRQQLLDYADKVKRRHLSEEMQEEMEGLRSGLARREEELQELRNKIDGLEHEDDEAEKLKNELAEAEAELQEKDELLAEKNQQLEELRDAENGNDDAELQEKERVIEEQAETIEDQKHQMRQLEHQKDAELDALEERLESSEEAQKTLQEQVDNLMHEKEGLQTKLKLANSPSRDRTLQRLREELESVTEEKDNEIRSLLDRLQLAEASGDSKTQLAQQAAHDAREQLKLTTREKDAEIANLQKRLEITFDQQTDLEDCRRQLASAKQENQDLSRKDKEQEYELQRLRATMAGLEDETNTLHATVASRNTALQEMVGLRAQLSQREAQISDLQRTIDAQCIVSDELKQARSTISEQERSIKTLETTLKERTAELEVLREHADEPDSQLEGVQNIVRERDQELETLRAATDDTNGRLEALQRTADERLEQVEQLKEMMEKTKEELEEEIEVLENTLEEAEQDKENLRAKVSSLQGQVGASSGMQAELEAFERDLQRVRREKSTLEAEVRDMDEALASADNERSANQSKIRSLTKELDEARQLASLRSPTTTSSLREKLRASQDTIEQLNVKLAEKQDELEAVNARLRARTSSSPRTGQEAAARQRTLDLELAAQQHEKDANELRGLLRATTLELDAVRHRLEKKRGAAPSTPLSAVKADSAAAARLRDELIEAERRHAAELKGLARQIQWLRASVARQEGFRSSLGFEKRWLQMQIDTYTDCNKKQLRLLRDMGVKPPREDTPTKHDGRSHQRSRLRAAGLAVIAVLRMRKWRDEWAASRKLHESLVAKLDEMKRLGLRKNKYRVQ